MATIGDYLKGAAKYLGVGGATTAAVIGIEPAISGMIQPGINTSTGIEQRLKEAPKPPRKINYPGGVAYAQEAGASPRTERPSVDEYYQRSNPVYAVVPGLREGPAKQPFRGTGFGLIGNEWTKFYNENKGNINNPFYVALKDLNGKNINVNGHNFTFDSDKLISLIENEHEKIKSVGFFGRYMRIEFKDADKNRLIIPLTDNTVENIRTLVKY